MHNCFGYILMTIILKTEVTGHYLTVMEQFDLQLFEALRPPVGMTIREFTGSKKGDRVILDFRLPAKFRWQSDIVEDGHDDERAWFIDEGFILPWPLKSWRHKHIVEKIDSESSTIIDHISYECSNAILTSALKPLLYGAFYPRKKIYKQYFSNNQ